MEWVGAVGFGLVLLVIIALATSRRRVGSLKDPNTRLTTAELSESQRLLWEQAEQAIAAYKHARGAEVEPARAHVLRVADDAEVWVGVVEGKGASERQVLMARLAAEEIREFVNDALTRHPEEQQN